MVGIFKFFSSISLVSYYYFQRRSILSVVDALFDMRDKRSVMQMKIVGSFVIKENSFFLSIDFFFVYL